MSRQKEIINNPYLKRKLPRWDVIRWFILLVLCPILIFVYGTILLYAYRLLAPSHNDALHVMRPVANAWYFTAIIITIGTIGLWMNKIFQCYNNFRYKFFPFAVQKAKFGGFVILKVLAAILCTTSLIFALLLYDNYILVYKDRIVINKFSSFKEKTYFLHEVSAIRFIERVKVNNKIKFNPRHSIRFNDGSSYQTKDNMLDDDSLASYLSSQTHIQIDSLFIELPGVDDD